MDAVFDGVPFWEHSIWDEHDYEKHMDYLHFNPVKPGLVKMIIDLPYSSFHRYVKQGVYPVNWLGGIDFEIDDCEQSQLK
ncbi:hypothetical protein [Methylomonas aurea]|uniref:hypothetical protein n=1 Tax=Methylomonas aurea TaxID=2952224 RepID=UPI0035318B71